MIFNSIKVYARLKCDQKFKQNIFEVVNAKDGYKDILFFNGGIVQSRSVSKFRFCDVFQSNNTQSEIFDIVAKPVVESILEGYNGTILAYGQTGSGKTYTMTGSPKIYAERGVIPRCLQYIFSIIEKAEDKPIICISYMEIYNEKCFDLLSHRESKVGRNLEELPRVVVLEDKKGQPHLRNLSVVPVSAEEEAMRLMFLGDTNRVIAETPLNEYSSRSHCIFTIYIRSRRNSTQSCIYSKLNLVDLAGSERVYKSNISGLILHEAKHINVSLHFLQQVILALSQAKPTHIPYRNSLMTFILKDSLGGNCITVMLATLSLNKNNMQETISTCQFAQRVSLIKLEPVINELLDPYQEIQQLRSENQKLTMELAKRRMPSKLAQDSMTFSRTRIEDLESKLTSYLKTEDEFFKANISTSDFQHCLSYLKEKIRFLEIKLQKQEQLMHLAKEPNIKIKTTSADQIVSISKITNSQCVDLKQPADSLIMEQKMKSEVDYFLSRLTTTYEKAKLLSSAIEECQININYIKEKLKLATKSDNIQKAFLLSRELETQQQIYKKCLMDLRELKTESLQFEAGLDKAKTKLALSSLNAKHDGNWKFNSKMEVAGKNDLMTDFNEYLFSQELSNNVYGFNNPQKNLGFQKKAANNCNCFSRITADKSLQTNPNDFQSDCCQLSICRTNIRTQIRSCYHIEDEPYCCPEVQLFTCATHCLPTTNAIPACQQYLNVPKNALSKDDCHNSKCNEIESTYQANSSFSLSGKKSSRLVEVTDSDIQLLPSKLCRSRIHSPKYSEALSQAEQPTLMNVNNNGSVKESVTQKHSVVPSDKIFLNTDTETFKAFMSNISLTGDEETDKEICHFYRRKWQ